MTVEVLKYAEVIGDPITQSKSPLIHGFWLERLGIQAEYHTQHVTSEELGSYIESRRHDANWRGCNVTLPHKIEILDHISDPGGVRDSIGAANTVFRNEQDALVATNTDAAGFYAPLLDENLEGAAAIVIGTGGAARAVLFALANAKVKDVTILARQPLKAAALLAHFGLRGRVLAMDAKLPPADLLINASPLGMIGQPLLDIQLDSLPQSALVYDIVYNPLNTPLLQQAAVLGMDTLDGLDMLVGQAAIAFELFFGQAPPRDEDVTLRTRLTA